MHGADQQIWICGLFKAKRSLYGTWRALQNSRKTTVITSSSHRAGHRAESLGHQGRSEGHYLSASMLAACSGDDMQIDEREHLLNPALACQLSIVLRQHGGKFTRDAASTPNSAAGPLTPAPRQIHDGSFYLDLITRSPEDLRTITKRAPARAEQ